MVQTTTSVLDAPGGPLVLRLRGASHSGQTVRLESRKCTVGSGRECTLRLASPGIAPLHCLILRGPNATLVRRWAADTRLNGKGFNDALLNPGDRLHVGSLELDVLSLDDELSPASHRGAATAELAAQRSELAALRAQVDAERQAVEAERQQLASRHAAMEATLLRRQAELDQLTSALSARQAALVAAEEALAAAGEALDAQHRRLLQTEAEAQAALAERRQTAAEHEAVDRQCQAERAALEADRARLAEERACLDAERSSLDAERSRLAADRAALTNERSDFAAQCLRQHEEAEALAGQLAAREQSLDDRLRQLAQTEADLRAKADEFERQHVAWQSEQAEHQRRLAQREEQLQQSEAECQRLASECRASAAAAVSEEMRASLGQRQAEIDARLAEIATLQQQAAAAATAVAAERAALAAEREAIEVARQADENARNELERQRAEAEAELAERLAALTAEQSNLEADRRRWAAEVAAFETERRRWDEERARAPVPSPVATDVAEAFETATATANAAESLQTDTVTTAAGAIAGSDEALSPCPVERTTTILADDRSSYAAPSEDTAADFGDEPAGEAKHAGGPVDLAEVFRRVGLAVPNHDEHEDEPAAPPSDHPPAAVEPAGVSAPAAPAHEGHDEEDSVEEYMARLLQRVGGGSKADVAATPIKTAPTPAPEPAPLPAAPASNEPIAPRAVAPEKSVDLSVMRQVANFSAQSAIHKHSQRTTAAAVRSKLLVALLGILTAAALAALAYRYGATRQLIYGVAGAVLVSVVWGGQYMALLVRLVIGRMRLPAPQARPVAAGQVVCQPAAEAAEGPQE